MLWIRFRGNILVVLSLIAVAGPALALQQHSYAPADIEAGQGLYQGNCAGCHGPNGDGVQGADLSTGRFRRGTSDEDLIRVIRNGIPGTAMPPHEFLSVGDARTVVAFLRSLPAGGASSPGVDRDVRVGDPARGRTVFEGRGECIGCHSVNGVGSLVGPDLSRIGAIRTAASIERSILEPQAEVRAGARFFSVTDTAGNTVTGRLLNQDTHSVQLIGTDERLVAFRKSELQDYGFVDSPMPSYRDELSPDEIADLVGYLISLRGENTQ